MSNRKRHIEPFAQLHHWIWKEQIKPLAKLVLFAIYRWTAGFGRDTYKIADSTITEMTGIKSIPRWREYLEERKYFICKREDGKAVTYTIPPPSTFRHTPTNYKGHPPTDLYGLREAKDNIKDKLKESTLSDDLVVEMKNKYPNIDVYAVKDKMINYYKGKSVPLDYKFQQWCENERPVTDVSNGATFTGNDVVNVILRKITDIGSYKQPTFNDDEIEVKKIVKQIGWGNLCRMDKMTIINRIKNLNV